MATLEDQLRSAGLELYELPDWETRQTVRQLWISPSFWDWFDGTDALHDEKDKTGGRTMADHIEQLFCDLRCADRPGAGELRRVVPVKQGVWKLHPFGTRLYGWAPRTECLVVIAGALEAETKDKSLGNVNDMKRDEVLAFIKTNSLGKHVMIGDILALFPPPAKS